MTVSARMLDVQGISHGVVVIRFTFPSENERYVNVMLIRSVALQSPDRIFLPLTLRLFDL